MGQDTDRQRGKLVREGLGLAGVGGGLEQVDVQVDRACRVEQWIQSTHARGVSVRPRPPLLKEETEICSPNFCKRLTPPASTNEVGTIAV